MIPRLTTLSDIIRTGAERFEDRIALQPVSQGAKHLDVAPEARAFTYREVWNRARRGASALRGRGLQPGDRVLLAAPSSPDWLVAFFSIVEAELVAVPIPDAIGAPLVAAVAHHTGARLCIAGSNQRGLTRALGHVACVTMTELLAEGSSLAEPIAGLEERSHAPSHAADRLALLAFTSGSTSRPRAVEHTHGTIIANLRALLAARQSAAPETMLSMLPPAHLFELVVGQLAPLVVGGRIVYADALLPNRLVTAMRDHDVTRILVVPALLEAICRDVLGTVIDRGIVRPMCQHASAVSIAMKLRQYTASERDRVTRAVRTCIGESLLAVGLGGAAVSPGWSETLALLGISMDVGYGLTEAGPLVSLGWASDCPSGSVGRPLPGVEVRIDAGGEVLVQSAGVMRGYFGDAAATSAAVGTGWLRTGDRGRVDADGYLFIAGRIKEVMVTTAGDTLHPEEVEPYYASKAFADHCIVPLPGPDGNDTPALVVVPRDPDLSDERLDREFSDLRAAAPARYRVMVIVRRNEALPRTLLGKLKRRELGESVAAGLLKNRPTPVGLTRA